MKGTNKTDTKKPNIFKRMWKGIKEIVSELKKVSWPTFAKVMAETGIVIAVVVFFLLIILGFDSLLAWLFTLLVK
ncbi:MAG: preprotein translocase subunit SecE [Clostridia bacterium]|nr:preprotein translocase subunit SecE [Clostridia bacterium]